MLRKRPAAAGSALARPRKRPAAAGAPQQSVQPVSEATLPITEEPEWYGESDPTAQNQVFLVTAAKLVNAEDNPGQGGDGVPPPLRDPATLSKRDFREALQDSIAQPMYTHARGGRPPSRTLALDLYVGVKEGKIGEQHHHAAVKLFDANHRFLPFKLAMRWRWGIATHWSTSHSQTWSAIRYLHFPTPRKPVVDKQPEVWTRDGRKLNLFEESQEPFQAKAWKWHRERELSNASAKKPKKEPFSKLDFSAIVLEHRLLTPSAVLTHFTEKGSKAMQLWVHCKQRKLKEYIQDALQLESAKQTAAFEKETDWALVERLSQETCQCGGGGCLWWSLASEFFSNNTGFDKERFAASLRKVICMGPCKEARVPLVVGRPNCAKSTLLDPVVNVYGEASVLGKPKLGAPNGALGKLAKDDIRFVYFDDYRPVEYAAMPKENPTVPVSDFLALFCGQPFDVQLSQSFNDGHPSIRYRKGAAMTAKEDGLWDPYGIVTREEIRHMQARVEIFPATHVVGENPDEFEKSPACASSWCRWLVVDSVAYAARQPPCNFSGRGRRTPKALPSLPSTQVTGASSSVGLTLAAAQKAQIAQKREAALRRKQAKARQQKAGDEEDDPFGHGCSLD